MKKILLYILPFFLLVACGTTKKVTIEKVAAMQTLAETKAILSTLAADDMEGRDVGTDGIEKAAAFIAQKLNEAKAKPFFNDTYRDNFKAKGVATQNIVAWIEGSDEQLKSEYILIGAHYDHLGMLDDGNDRVYNGANDNASGVTAALQIAHFLAQQQPKRSILIALFSAEEKGLLGSTHLAEKLKNKGVDIKYMFNLEMLGTTLSQKPGQVYITGYKKSNMPAVVNEILGEPFVQFLATAKKYALFYRSDNFPFFEQFGIPAHTFSTFDFTNYEYYHHTQDEIEELDIENMNAIIHKLSLVILKMANTKEVLVKMKD